ncbi:pickpocket protein 28-like [Ostrinia furnacalis]|uniref:pickpocket protein 28-like n=1 Tax=Ostrinia furnacalis TaxID=93504 RepID=UPI00103FDDA7|nr:pickpocket protein 28-like [Ostrinia furnacalis]
MIDDYSYKSPNSYQLNSKNGTNIQEVESSKKKKRPRPFRDNLKDFFSNTTLHGFRYVLDERFTLVERIWWVVMVIISIVVCAFFIRKVWVKWDETPVIVSFAETSNSVWHIPFPAVTLCSETKPRQRIFNFTKASKERWSNPSMISDEDLKLYHDMLLLCNNDRSDGPDYADIKSSIKTLQKLAPPREELFMDCLWQNLTCPEMFFPTLTKDGYCYTFNMLSADEMFRMENLHKDYYHVGGMNRSKWTLERGYPNDETVQTYPLRGPSYGGVEFEVILLTDIRDLDQVCRGPVQGFKIWLHSPAELPNMGQNFFRLPIQYQSAAAIMPRVMDTSDGLKHYPPHKRQCYFPDERYLHFFRTYTQRNCELECSSNHTALRCGCVPLYMPHGPNTKVCGGGKRQCILDALEELSLSKSSLRPESKNQVQECDCLQACTELKYDAEVSQAVYDLTTYRLNPDPDIAQGWRLPSGLVVYFSDEIYTSLRRSELYGGVDFLANCGGIMGLFMGFSFLSLVEIIYYFSMRLFCHIRRSSTVEAET